MHPSFAQLLGYPVFSSLLTCINTRVHPDPKALFKRMSPYGVISYPGGHHQVGVYAIARKIFPLRH